MKRVIKVTAEFTDMDLATECLGMLHQQCPGAHNAVMHFSKEAEAEAEDKGLIQRMEKILYDTIAFYSEDPSRRAFESRLSGEINRCVYETEDGRCCAVGRLMSGRQLLALHNLNKLDAAVNDLAGILEGDCEGYPGELMELTGGVRLDDPHAVSMMVRLQSLHDTGNNWDDNGLTERGLVIAKAMCNAYGLDPNKAIPNPIPRPQATTKETI